MSEYYRPATKAEALGLLGKYGKDLLIVNGGTDAVLSIVEGKVEPKAIMQVSQLPDFHRIWTEGGFLHIAGGATFREMMESAEVAPYQGLVEALGHLASPSIRVIGTAAGYISADVHSPADGVVSEIRKVRVQSGAVADAVVIKCNPEQSNPWTEKHDWKSLSSE